jgi:predicted metal-dependent hydrolase
VSAQVLLERLRQRDVRLEADGGLLHVDAPSGAVTEELREALVEHKPKLLKLLEWERECERRDLEEANHLGLVVRWSDHPVWIQLHDPTTGEWHEVRAEECLPGVVETADRYCDKEGDS